MIFLFSYVCIFCKRITADLLGLYLLFIYVDYLNVSCFYVVDVYVVQIKDLLI